MVWPLVTPPNFRGLFRFWISKHKFQSFWPKYFSVCYHSSCWTVVLNLPRVYHSICSCINNQSVSFLTFTANSPMWPRITISDRPRHLLVFALNGVYQKYPKIKSPTILESVLPDSRGISASFLCVTTKLWPANLGPQVWPQAVGVSICRNCEKLQHKYRDLAY